MSRYFVHLHAGRQFYKCPRQSDAGSCNFFLWADQTVPGNGSSSGDSHMTSNYSLHDPVHSNVATMGQHGLLSVQGHKRERATSRGGSTNRSKGGGTSERVLVVECNCGDEATERTVQKDGPNKGKQFYTCSKPRDQQCQFFEWSSNLPASSVHSYSASRAGRGRGRGGRGGGSSGALMQAGDDGNLAARGKRKRAPPTCSVCREAGHTKRTCPLNQ